MDAKTNTKRRRPFLRFTVAGAVVAGGVFAPLWLRLQWNPVVAYAIGITLATLLLYGYDKLAAVRQFETRIPEATLHVFELVGGGVGALIGQKLFRHKTVKRSFRVVFWLILLLQVALLAGYLYWRWRAPSSA